MTRNVFAMDFEATTDPNDCRVWAWQYMDIFDLSNTDYGTDLDSFMGWLLNQDCDAYFHNLRYDGSFILVWLLEHGFVFNNSKKPPEGTFRTVISESGQWYEIDITTQYVGKSKPKRKHVRLLDSYKKLPMPIKRIAKAFNLPVLKGEIDYHKERPIGYELDEEEIKYLKADVEILARGLKTQYDENLVAMTIGSDALKDFTNRIGGKEKFLKLFPILDTKLDSFLRASYKGGFTWVKPSEQGEIIGDGVVLDVNSLYPWAMRYKLLPYGEPMRFKGKYKPDKNYPLYIVKIECEFEVKPNMIPTIQIKNSRFNQSEYLETSGGEPVILTLTSVDLELFLKHYDVIGEVKYIEGYKFRAYRGFFDDYIDYWSEIKKANKGNPLEQLAKLMLNSLYGKFGKNPEVTPKIPYLREDGSLKLDVPRDSKGKKIPEFTDPVYIPMGSFITAYARELTISSAQSQYHRLIYCDTDSMHLKGSELPTEITVHAKDLGAWKHEYTFVKAKYLRQKTYVDIYPITWKSDNGKFKINRLKTDIKCAGLPEQARVKLTFDDFKIGLFLPDGRLKPKQVPGGQVLLPEPFTLK